jgi:hypothetical protein
MKKSIKLTVCLLAGAMLVKAQTAQKWSDLTKEEKQMKMESFRTDNQKFLKDTLKLSQPQLDDIDNVNICYLSTLDRINRYGKSDAEKENYAKAVTSARSAQLDAIMGPEKRKKFQTYVQAKLKKAGVM